MIKRIRDLFIKLVSVKGIMAIASFVSFAINPSEWTFYLAVIFGALFIVGREYGKLLEVLKIIKGH